MDGPETYAGTSPRWLVLGGLALAALLIMVLYPDLRSLRNSIQDLFGYGGSHSDAEQGRDLFHTDVGIGGMRDGLTYNSFDARRDEEATTSFYGFGCLDSCDDNMAGYRWAVRHNVKKPAECGGLTWGFAEGCAAYSDLQHSTR